MNKAAQAPHFTTMIQGEELMLLPERAILWKRKKLLLLSDLHLARSGHFRKAGIPVSSKVHEEDLNRLSEILQKISADKIYLLGDLFHSSHNREWKQFEKWRAENASLNIFLVKGNHDLYNEKKMQEHGIDAVYPFVNEAPFFFSHQPVKSEENLYNIFGHIHPAIRFKGRANQSAKFLCFWFSRNFGVLPSFGNFTGSAIITPTNGDRVFAIIEKSVREIG